MVKSSSAKQQKEGGKAAPVKVKVGKTSVAANKKKPKIARPIPKSWPVSSHLSYPPPNSTTNTNDNNEDDDSATEQQTSLKPGKTLQQNCNGCDVFLRKSAVQSTSASIIPTKQNSHSKGAVKRFLIVFPGRMTLKAPPAAAPTAAAAALKEDASKDETNDGDNDIKKDDNATTKEDKSETTAAKPTKRNPFAPANPPQLLGRLVSLGGADQKVELRIPFPSNNNTNDDNKPKDNVKAQNEQQKQMVMSGRAIPLSGKYMVLSFKRTGGKDSIAASSASTPKNKKMGTGSIACKDIFRSVIVLGESQMVDQDDRKKVDVGSSSGCGEDVRVSHYGGSERTVDGGGKNDASTSAGAAAKRKFKSVTAPTTSLKQTHDGDENSVMESLGSDSDEEDDDDDIEMKNGSDDEFVPISSKKKQSASASKKRKSSDSNVDTPVARKRTPRRSAAKAAKVKYADDDSDVDMSDNDSDKSDDDNSGKSPTVTQEIDDDSDVSSVVEEIVPKKKRASVAPANKKRKLSGGSSRNGDADESSCIVIDSDDDDIKTPKPSSKTNGLKKATGSRSVTAKGKAPSSPLKSVSPRRRKKLSPNKPSPKKPVSLDLDDDPFAFL